MAHVGLRGNHRGVQGSSLVASTALFGVETTGMAASVCKTMRVAMAKTVSPGRGARTCPVTLLALPEGQALNPDVVVPTRVISHWAGKVWQGALPAPEVAAYWEAHGGWCPHGQAPAHSHRQGALRCLPSPLGTDWVDCCWPLDCRG